MRSLLLRYVMQRGFVVSYRRFAVICGSCLEWSNSPRRLLRTCRYPSPCSAEERSTLWFWVPFTSQPFLFDGELRTETCYKHHPLKYKHILISIAYVPVFFCVVTQLCLLVSVYVYLKEGITKCWNNV